MYINFYVYKLFDDDFFNILNTTECSIVSVPVKFMTHQLITKADDEYPSPAAAAAFDGKSQPIKDQ